VKFILASNNNKKLKELKKILNDLNIEILTAKEVGIDLSEIKETGNTFKENAEIKAKAAVKRSGLPAIADDSGLEVDILNGEPGIYSARYAGENSTDEENIKKLLNNLKEIKEKNCSASFTCAICCVFPDGRKIFSEKSRNGEIIFVPKGTNGFGYDPIFKIETGKTFAELSEEEKNMTSHRSAALKDFKIKLLDFLKNNS